MENSTSKKYGRWTEVLHCGKKPGHWTHRPIMTPIYTTTTFMVPDMDNDDEYDINYDYSRSDNPTRTQLQSQLAALESAKYGLAFCSGLGAMTTLAFLLRSGQSILCCDDVYGGSRRLFSQCLSRMAIETVYVDGTQTQNWLDKFEVGKTKLVWMETPTNPTMKVMDIRAVASAVKQLDPTCIVAVDNTFMTPILQSPLELGADLVMHSASKYLGGHSDIIMGAIMANDDKIYEELKTLQNSLGGTPSVRDCSLMIRSIMTLMLRVERQSQNAMKVAQFLESHKYVDKVYYPGLKSHPQHELSKRQCADFGGMLSVCIKTIVGDESRRFMAALRIFHPAESLGCVCSLIQIPALMTHSSVPEATREMLGICNNLLRLSIGIENVEDLIEDLSQAFDIVYKDD